MLTLQMVVRGRHKLPSLVTFALPSEKHFCNSKPHVRDSNLQSNNLSIKKKKFNVTLKKLNRKFDVTNLLDFAVIHFAAGDN
jgi:hypothetical protein